MKLSFALLMLSLSLSLPLLAKEAAPATDDPATEKRVMRLSAELRCLVCQNQSLAESNADLAIDLKNEVRNQMQAGRSDDEIRAFMVARYGDFVLYSPPLKASTMLLWAGPFVLLVAGALTLVVYLRRRRGKVAQADLSPDQRAQARALLRSDGDGR